MFPRFLYTAAALLAASSLQVNATPQVPPISCDAKPQVLSVQYPNDVVKMTGIGVGACGIGYKEMSHVACMKDGWTSLSNVQGKGCQRWIKVENTLHGSKTDAQILDVCKGDNPASELNLRDIILAHLLI